MTCQGTECSRFLKQRTRNIERDWKQHTAKEFDEVYMKP